MSKSTPNPAKLYFDITSRSRYLEGLSKEEQIQIPHKLLAEKLWQVDFGAFKDELTDSERDILQKRDIEDPVHFVVRPNEKVEESICQNLLTILELSGKNNLTNWSGIRGFWRRTYGKEKNTSDVNRVLSPIARFCGYADFADFVEKNFSRSEVFTIVILPFFQNGEGNSRSEKMLLKRFKALSDNENIALDVRYLSNYRYTYLSYDDARNIGLEQMADLVIFGDLLLYGEKKINLYYTLVKADPLVKDNRGVIRSDNFLVSELLQGTLPNDIDYLIYWVMGMQAYQHSQRSASRSQSLVAQALHCFNKIVNELNIPDAEIFFRMAVIYELDGNKKEAIACYYRALDANPNHYISMLNLGLLHTFEKNFDAAGAVLQQFLIGFNAREQVLYEVGRTYMGITLRNLGEIELARINLRNVIMAVDAPTVQGPYKEVWALAFLELGELHHRANTEHGEENIDVHRYFLKAARLSSDKELHEQIIPYFEANGHVTEIMDVIHTHPAKDELMALYSELAKKIQTQ